MTCAYGKYFVSSFLLLAVLQSVAQVNLKFTHYTTQDGLSQGTIFHILQDSRGFMWFGSLDGLNRFDGYNFMVFKPQANNINSIAGTHIKSMIEDKQGMLWIGTNEALNLYNYNNNIFKHFYLRDEKGQAVLTTYNPFYIDDKNELWFTYSTHNLASLNLETGKISLPHYADNLLESYTIADLTNHELYKPLHKIITCGSNGLKVIDTENKKVKSYFSNDSKNIYGKPSVIFQVRKGKEGLLWLASDGGLISFDEQTNEEAVFNISNDGSTIKPVIAITEDSNGNMWAGTDGNGLWLFDKTSHTFMQGFFHDTKNEDGIASRTVSALYTDKCDNIWMNADPNGIDRINPSHTLFSVIRINDNTIDKIISASAVSFAELNKDETLVSFNRNGLMLFNKSTLKRELIYLPPPFKENYISTVFKTSKGIILLITDKGVLHASNARGPYRLLQNMNNDKFMDVLFSSMLQVNSNTILVAYTDGVALIETNTTKPVWKKILSEIKNITSATKGHDGLYYLCGNEKSIIRLGYYNNNFSIADTIITSFTVKSLYHQSKEIIWMATNKGLAQYNISTKTYKWFTEQNGLNNNFIYSIVPDEKNSLWLSTNGGISRFNITENKFYNYSLNDGLQGFEYNSNAFCKTSDGTIYFGGVNGFNYFNPSAIKEQVFDPPLQITEIKINNKPVPLSLFSGGNNTTLPYNENNITIGFAAIDFNRSANINYLYKLHEDDGWINIGRERTLTFPRLSADDYHLMIKASVADGVASKNTISVRFKITTAWYSSWWFIAGCSIAVLSIGYFIYLYRLQQIRKVYVLRTKISQDLHDEVGATLTSISFLSEVARQQSANENKPVLQTLDKIGGYSRDMIGEMSDIVWAINPANDKFDKIVLRMKNFALPLLAAKKIELVFTEDFELKHTSLNMEQRKNLYLIFKEAINNAAKYSNCTTVNVKMRKQNNHLQFAVEDNGAGFPPDNVTNGNGLINMQCRAKEINANITINSSCAGTNIMLSIPIT